VHILGVFNDKQTVSVQALFSIEADAPDINLRSWRVSSTSAGEGHTVKHGTSLLMRDLNQRGPFTKVERCRAEPVLSASIACRLSRHFGSGWSSWGKPLAWLVSWCSPSFWSYVLERYEWAGLSELTLTLAAEIS